MHSYIHRILDTKDPPDAEEIENPYKWYVTLLYSLKHPYFRILIVELVIFLIHFYICTKDSVKYKQKYTEHKNEGTQFKFQLTQAIGLGSLGLFSSSKGIPQSLPNPLFSSSHFAHPDGYDPHSHRKQPETVF